MSELINTKIGNSHFRGRLLATVCTVAMVTAILSGGGAKADDTERPTVWIDLGGQLERMSNGQESFAPSFLSQFDHLNFNPVMPVQQPLRHAYGAEGKVSFEPNGSDWVLSAAIRYGRSSGKKADYQRLPSLGYPITFFSLFGHGKPGYRFQAVPYHLNASAVNTERHTILDFQAGKDVGLGMFSASGRSVLSLGIRFAQMTSERSNGFNGVPDFYQRGRNIGAEGVYASHHRYLAAIDEERSFSGVGPSLSWDASAPVVGDDDGGIALDWGLNAALLFGRQKVSGDHEISGSHYKQGQRLHLISSPYVILQYHSVVSSYHQVAGIARSHSAVVPNLGAFAGLSFKYADAKVSFGYRADFFFGAMDGGIDARETYDRNFYGPFATISIGLGG